jgi:hypothetical protein
MSALEVVKRYLQVTSLFISELAGLQDYSRVKSNGTCL